MQKTNAANMYKVVAKSGIKIHIYNSVQIHTLYILEAKL